MKFALALVAGLALTAGCSKKAREIAGVGPWNVTKTILKQADGRCTPTDLPDGRKGSWCFGQAALKIAGRAADVDLYFDGVDPSSKLIELQLQIRGCEEAALDTWMRQTFGVPFENRADRGFWKNSHMFAAAFMPSGPGQCLVRIFPTSEANEFERIKNQ